MARETYLVLKMGDVGWYVTNKPSEKETNNAGEGTKGYPESYIQ